MPGFALLLWFVHATWCYLKGALERERRIKACWHRGPHAAFCSLFRRISSSVRCHHVSEAAFTEKTNPRPRLRPPLSPLLGGDITHRSPAPVWFHPGRPGRNMLAPYGALPARGDGSGAAGGSLRNVRARRSPVVFTALLCHDDVETLSSLSSKVRLFLMEQLSIGVFFFFECLYFPFKRPRPGSLKNGPFLFFCFFCFFFCSSHVGMKL